MPSRWASALLAAPVLAAFAAVLLACVQAAASMAAWQDVWHAPHVWSAIGMSLWTGLASGLIAWALTAWLLSHAFGQPWWQSLVRRLGWLLAVPHAAFAVGLVFLLAPSGWLLRLASPWLTGFDQPPALQTSQDPWGLGLVAMLVFKELPFLLWAAATQWQRDDVGARLLREAQAAQCLGYSAQQAYWRIVWPQLRMRLLWPLLAVLAYGLTVVDAALIAGPGTPATLSVRAWQWLQDSEASTNAQGAAAGWLLAALVALAAFAAWAWLRASPYALKAALTTGHRGRDAKRSHNWPGARWAWAALLAVYASVLLALAVGSVSGLWPFPGVLPQTLSWDAWQSVANSSKSVWLTLVLGVCSSAMALGWSLAWLEMAPVRWDTRLRGLLYVPLLLPGVLWVVGLHQLALYTHSTGTFVGLLMAHSLAVLPYSLIALSPAYLGFDARYGHICASLRKTRWEFLRHVKWPMLRQSLWAAAAVGFAVSVAQFLPTVYVGEGRHLTVTTEAVTLSSGGQRSLVAAYAWLQFALPALAFALATWLGKPRSFQGQSPAAVGGQAQSEPKAP